MLAYLFKECAYCWLATYVYVDYRGSNKKSVWSKAIPESDIADEKYGLTDNIYNGKPSSLTYNCIIANNRYSTNEFSN